MYFKIKFKIINLLLRLASFLFGYQAPPVPSASAIIQKDDKILVIELSYKDGYALPGGIIKGNEDFESAVRREIMEETGLEVTSLEYFSSSCVVDPYSKVNVTYLANVKGKLTQSKEGNPVWKDPEEILDSLVYKDNIKIMEEFLPL